MTINRTPLLRKIFPPDGRPTVVEFVLWGLGLVLGVSLFILTRNFVVGWTLTPLPGLPISSLPEELPLSSETPTPQVPQVQLPKPWDGASRVTVLFLGLDARDWVAGEGAPRSDTMMLLTVDPQSKTAGMLSIPRDMWVPIPGIGYSKINTAFAYGQAAKLPGGGPGLAMKTVEAFIGVPIDHYIQVDFTAFEEAIDGMGGLELCIDEKIRVDPIGPMLPKVIKPGCQTLPGYMVLAYARQRKDTREGDIDRARHQQKVVLALRDKILDPAYFPKLLAKTPELYLKISSGVHTDLSLDEMLRLAALGQQIPVENIRHGVIDYSMAPLDSVMVDGLRASILRPIPDKIRELRDEIFDPAGVLGPSAQGDPVALMKAEGAHLKLLNGSTDSKLAEQTQQYLNAQGAHVDQVGTADQHYSSTVVILYTEKLYTMRYLRDLFKLSSPGQIRFAFDPSSPVDVEVILGKDWQRDNPLP